MQSRLLFAVATLLATAACEIPGRSNPKDPANVPDVRIDVFDLATGGNSIFQAALTETIFLSIEGTEPSGHRLRVSWLAVFPDGSEVCIDACVEHALEGRERVRFVDQGVAVGESGARSFNIVAFVRDLDTGGVGSASRLFQVLNQPPLIATQRYLEYPPGGEWWDGGTNIVVRLSATATDPDPEDGSGPIDWIQVGGADRPGVLQADGTFTVALPIWEESFVYRAMATDSAGGTNFADVTVAVQDVIWSIEQSGEIVRVQEPPLAVSITNATMAWALGATTDASGDTSIWTAEHNDGGNWFVTRRVPELRALASRFSTDLGLPTTNDFRTAVLAGNTAWFAAGSSLHALGPTGAATSVGGGALDFVLPADPALTSPHALAVAETTSDVWALINTNGGPALRRYSPAGAVVIGDDVPDGIAVESGANQGAWVLVDDAAGPLLRRFNAAGDFDTDLVLPPLAIPEPRTFAARAPQQPGEPLRFAVAGGSSEANFYLALLEARDGSCLGSPQSGPGENVVLCVTFRLQEAPVADLSFDAQDGALWSLIAKTGKLRKHAADGTVIRSEGGFSFGPHLPTVRVDASTGTAWVADETGTLRGTPGAPKVPYPAAAVLSSPDRLQLDPVHNELVTSGLADASVFLLFGGEQQNQIFLPDVGAFGGPVGVGIDPEPDRGQGCLWFATTSLLKRRFCDPIVNVTLAPLDVLAIDVDPGTGDVCVGGKTGSTPHVTRVGPNGQTLFTSAAGALDGSTLTGVRVSPTDGSCWFLTDDSIGRILADGTLDRQQSFLANGWTSLSVGPDGRAYVIDSDAGGFDGAILRGRPNGDAGCLSDVCIDTFHSFAGDPGYRHPRSISVDPVRGTIWVATGPTAADASAPALLKFTKDGVLVGVAPATDPTFVIVNR